MNTARAEAGPAAASAAEVRSIRHAVQVWRSFSLLALAGAVFLLAACTSNDGVIVGRTAETYSVSQAGNAAVGQWVPVAREAATADAERPVRFRLTVTKGSLAFDVLVSPECFDAVQVSYDWPSAQRACR